MSEVELEREMTRTAVADYLRSFAEQLDHSDGQMHTSDGDGQERGHPEHERTRETSDEEPPSHGSDANGGRSRDVGTTADGPATGEPHTGNEKVTFMVGNDSATVNPPDTVSFTVHVGNESGIVQDGNEQVSFDIVWPSDDVEPDDELEVI